VLILFAEAAAAGEGAGGRELASFILAGAAESLIERRHHGLAAEIDDMLVCVINLRLLAATEWNLHLEEIAAELRRHAAESLGVGATVGVSTIQSGLALIPQCYQEALDALEHKLVVGAGRVIRFEEIGERRSRFLCPLETEQQLLNAVRAGDRERATEVFDRLFQSNFADARPSIQSIKCLVFDVYNTLLKAIAHADEGRQRQLTDQIQPLMNVVAETRSLDELAGRVREVIGSLCATTAGIKKDDRLALEIKAFVAEGCHDLNLSIAMIAEHFRMTQGYISRLFREMSGEGLLDHIASVRLAAAKRLMEQKRRPLGEIAAAVGYTSANALIRAFKKHEGVTPGRYRELL
jgi:AraC-like DNA-binding protein